MSEFDKQFDYRVNAQVNQSKFNSWVEKTDKIKLSQKQFFELYEAEAISQKLNTLEPINQRNLVGYTTLFVPCISINDFIVEITDGKDASMIMYATEPENTGFFPSKFIEQMNSKEVKEKFPGYYKEWVVILKNLSNGHLAHFGVIGVERNGECIFEMIRENNILNQTVASSIMLAFAAIQNRLSYTDDFDVEEKKVTTSAKKKKKGKKAYTQHKVRLYKCYTLTRVAPVKNLHKKKVVITCPAWGVRGHYRHYKSGKVVFISPYTKGKDRNNYQPKEYGLFKPMKGGEKSEAM